MSLAGSLASARKELEGQAGGAIARLATTASLLEMNDTGKRLTEIAASLKADTFSVMISGQFKNGKSTLLNALLGRPDRPIPDLGAARGPMPTDPLPCTATLTAIKYAETPAVTCWRFDGTSEAWSLQRYLTEGTIRDDEDETRRFFEYISRFELGYPAELCRSGVFIWDSPGLNDTPAREAVTREAARRCDCAVAVYRSDVLGGLALQQFVQNDLLKAETKAFFVINLWADDQPAGRLLAMTWNKIVKDLLGGEKYSGESLEDFAARDIFFVQAANAEEGKWTGNQALVAQSGLEALERRLAEFLLQERFAAHFRKFVRGGEIESQAVASAIGERRLALDADTVKLQAAYAQLDPQFQAIEASRNKLPRLFASHRQQSQLEMRASYEAMIARARAALPDALASFKPPSAEGGVLKKLTAPLWQGRIAEDITAYCNDFITTRTHAWANGDAREIITAKLEALGEELEAEATRIDQQFAEIQFELLGEHAVQHKDVRLVGTGERVASAIVGFFAGDVVGAVTGGATGWRGAAGSIGTNVVFWLFLAPLLPIGAWAIPLGIVLAGLGGLGAGGVGLTDRIKRSVVEGDGKKNLGISGHLAEMPAQMAPMIDQGVDQTFAEVERAVVPLLAEVIAEKRNNIRIQVELNRKSLAEKEQYRAKLDAASEATSRSYQVLHDILTKSGQISSAGPRATAAAAVG